MLNIYFLLLFSFFCFLSAEENDLPSTNEYKVVSTVRRNKLCYTQGLIFNSTTNTLIESCGLYHQSSFRVLNYSNLTPQKEIILPSEHFAEGIAKCGNYYYQLTWREKIIYKFSSSFQYIKTIPLPLPLREGWGLSASENPNELLLTDGSDKIYWVDCENDFNVNRRINVYKSKESISKLNDLIYANDYIWANQYLTEMIYKIDPENGKVKEKFNMSSIIEYEYKQNTLTKDELNRGFVLNGIAYNDKNHTFIITGKNWGYYYEIQFFK